MDFSKSFDICASGLSVQRTRMDVVASNLANVHTTQTAEGGPYRRKIAVLKAETVKTDDFGGALDDAVRGVKVSKIVSDSGEFKKVHDPAHPDADSEGYVMMPNVNTVQEMADMITVSRAYEACVTAFDATKSMALKALEIGK
jgi:flagellar basal-body rod protein FlgC